MHSGKCYNAWAVTKLLLVGFCLLPFLIPYWNSLACRNIVQCSKSCRDLIFLLPVCNQPLIKHENITCLQCVLHLHEMTTENKLPLEHIALLTITALMNSPDTRLTDCIRNPPDFCVVIRYLRSHMRLIMSPEWRQERDENPPVRLFPNFIAPPRLNEVQEGEYWITLCLSFCSWWFSQTFHPEPFYSS